MKTRDLLIAASVPLIWGLGFTIAKAGLGEFPPLFLMGMRFTLAAALVIWFLPIPRGHLKDIFWIALIGSSIQYGLTFTGLSQIDASLAVIIVHLLPGLTSCIAISGSYNHGTGTPSAAAGARVGAVEEEQREESSGPRSPSSPESVPIG